MTSQEVFDRVVNHLRAQGRKSKFPDGTCAYRSRDGARCAVGCLIEDGEYTFALEGSPIDSLLEDKECPATIFARLGPHQPLLEDLQRIHDTYALEEWEGGFLDVAEAHVLSVPPIEASA